MSISKILSWTVVIFWMILIFNLSSQVAQQSNQLSTGIAEIIIKTVERIVPQVDLDIYKLNNLVRKSTHFFLYLIFGLLVINALRRSGVYGYRSIVLVLLICVLYAISDEVHQLFVPDRGGEVKDIIIDSAGATVGIGVYLLTSSVGKLRRKVENDKLKCTSSGK